MKLASAFAFAVLGAVAQAQNLRQHEEDAPLANTFDHDEELIEADEEHRELSHKQKYLGIRTTNIMQAQVLSRFFYMTHKCGTKLFELGEMSSPELARLAEDGNPVPLFDMYKNSPAVCDLGYNMGPTGPGESAEFDLKIKYCDCFTIASMLVGTNDSFGAVNGAKIRWRSSATYPAFDAGSEGNSELCEHIPGPPCNTGALQTNAGSPENYVHVNRGISGDFDVGFTYDWRNPVISVSSYVHHQ